MKNLHSEKSIKSSDKLKKTKNNLFFIIVFIQFATIYIVGCLYLNIQDQQKKQDKILEMVKIELLKQGSSLKKLVDSTESHWTPFEDEESIQSEESEEEGFDWETYFNEQEREEKNEELMTDMCLRQGKLYSPSSGICIDIFK